MYSSEKAVISVRRVAPSVFSTTASWMRARLPAASAPASTSTEAISATPAAARIAVPSWPTSRLTTSSASLTRTVVTAGKGAGHGIEDAGVVGRAWRPLSVSVASQPCGAPANVLGENTMTKLMPIVSHCTCAEIGDPGRDVAAKHIDGDGVAELQARSALPSSAENETSGSPA